MFLLNIVQYPNDHIHWRNATQSFHHWFLLPYRRDMFQLNIVQYPNDHFTGAMQRSPSIYWFLLPYRRDMFLLNIVQYPNDHIALAKCNAVHPSLSFASIFT